MRAAFYTLGCKVNQYETQAMEQLQVIDHRARKKNAGKAYIIGAMKSTIKEFNESVSKLPRKLREQAKEFQQMVNEQK